MAVQLLDVILVKAKMKQYTIAEVSFSFYLYSVIVLCFGQVEVHILDVMSFTRFLQDSIQDISKLDVCALSQKRSIAATGLKIYGTSSLECLVGTNELVGDPLLRMPGFLLYY